MFYSNGQLAVAQIPKAGLRSIREWLGPAFRVASNEDALECSTRVAFVRHPVERLRSAFSFFYWTNYGEKQPPKEWEAFVDFALVTDDEHWRPQAEHFGDVPNRIHRFEHLASYVDQYHPGFLDWHGRSTRLPTNEYRAGDIERFYADDLAIWMAA